MKKLPRSRSGFASFRKTPIFYRERGKGEAVVLLHGFMEHSEMWDFHAKELSHTYRVITIDLPGHGKSGNLGYVHSMELMADAVKAMLKALDIRRCHMIGHSMGGYVALAFAETEPDMLKSLTLFHSTASEDTPEKKKNRLKAIKIIKKDLVRYVNEAIPALFYRGIKLYTQQIKKAKRMALENSNRGIVAAQQGMHDRIDRTIILPFAPYRLHYIIGEFDEILPAEKLKEEASYNKKTTVTFLEDCGHMGHVECPLESLKAIRMFLKG